MNNKWLYLESGKHTEVIAKESKSKHEVGKNASKGNREKEML